MSPYHYCITMLLFYVNMFVHIMITLYVNPSCSVNKPERWKVKTGHEFRWKGYNYTRNLNNDTMETAQTMKFGNNSTYSIYVFTLQSNGQVLCTVL